MEFQEKTQARQYIKERLHDNHLTQVWLVGQLGENGIIVDKTALSSILSGARTGPKSDYVITTAQAILEKYQKTMA